MVYLRIDLYEFFIILFIGSNSKMANKQQISLYFSLHIAFNWFVIFSYSILFYSPQSKLLVIYRAFISFLVIVLLKRLLFTFIYIFYPFKLFFFRVIRVIRFIRFSLLFTLVHITLTTTTKLILFLIFGNCI